VADPNLENSAVANIESDLIETLKPPANVSNPIPPHTIQNHTKEIIAEFRLFIHGYRSERFKIGNIEAEI
jgi:hypothetical protein